MKAFKRLLGLSMVAPLTCFLVSSPAFAQNRTKLERPPQYILFSFDGSKDLSAWKTIRDFSKEMKAQDKDVRFTFFISGVYFLGNQTKSKYVDPRDGKSLGKSAIGFGATNADISARISQINKALSEGHEMGSHANGHFDGTSWTNSMWMSEFNQFNNFIFNVFSINGISQGGGWEMSKENIKGFRAPQLGRGKPLWETLGAFNYGYDASTVEKSGFWPVKTQYGYWRFPLTELKIAGTGKKTLSMDYNFYYSQTAGVADTANKQRYKKEMFETYMAWFQESYFGHRAPMNIGHHFSMWNGGAYFEALKDFASEVCGLAEVKCVTYQEYTKWLESLSQVTLSQYSKGLFDKMPAVRLADISPTRNVSVRLVMRAKDSDASIFVRALVPDKKDLKDFTAEISVDGVKLGSSEVPVEELKNIATHTNEAFTEVTAHLYDKEGVEIARSTQRLYSGPSVDETVLSLNVKEARALQGDLPEAHADESNEVPADLD